jgi:hypothetical protein
MAGRLLNNSKNLEKVTPRYHTVQSSLAMAVCSTPVLSCVEGSPVKSCLEVLKG